MYKQDYTYQQYSLENKSKYKSSQQKPEYMNIEYLSQKYPLRIISEIGKGAYGIVYECMDGNRIVAAKKIFFEKNGLRCLNEASIMASIKHPHITTSHFVFCDESAMYIISEKAICDLNKWTRKTRKGKIPDIKTLYKWTTCIVSALSCLHSQGVIHCDMKAANVLLFSMNDVRLNDFTLALVRHEKGKKYTHNTSTSTHRSLEVWLGKEWDEKMDIWGLGCTLFEIAYGQLLFPYQGTNSPSDIETKEKAINCLLDWGVNGLIKDNQMGLPKNKNFIPFQIPPEYYNPAYQSFNDMVMKMLQLDPNKRPSIFEIQKHPYFQQDNKTSMKKVSFIVYSSEGIISSSYERAKKKYQEIIDKQEVLKLCCEIYMRTYGLKLIETALISEEMRQAVCLSIATKLMKYQVPHSTYGGDGGHSSIGLTSNQIYNLYNIEAKFCEYLSFRIHVSPDTINDEKK